MKQKLFTLLTLLVAIVTGALADDAQTTLFSTSFTDAKYNVTFPTVQTGSVDVVDGGTTVSIRGYKNAAWEWSSTNGIKFTKNNLNANAGEISATSPNYCIAIPLTGVNGTITVTTTNVTDAKWYYSYTTDADQSTIVARQQATSNNTFTINGLTQTNVTLFIGMSEKQIKSITITTPKAVAPGAISFSPAAGSVAPGTSITLSSYGATTIQYQWGASTIGE
ncbi:MAG: hypothetical protein IKN75_10910 [Prevotella sp.]|nr:hypothetical protein [Prevotella sp.]